MEHIVSYLHDAFVNKQIIGLEKYNQVMELKFMAKLNGSLQYTKLQIFEGFPKWFECKILDWTTNLLQ